MDIHSNAMETVKISTNINPPSLQTKSAVALVAERRIHFVRGQQTHTTILTKKSLITKTKGHETTRKRLLGTNLYEIERLLRWKTPKPIGPGLANLGNTCYLNSTLQCLLYTPCFAQYLLLRGQQRQHEKINTSNIFCSTNAMMKLVQIVHRHDKSMKNGINNHLHRVLQPKMIVQNLRHIAKRFRVGRQEDAHEFFRLLLDSMQTSCLKQMKGMNHGALKDPNMLSGQSSRASSTWLHQMFGGELKNHLSCSKCPYVSEKLDTFLDLALEIEPSQIQSIEQALGHFTHIETLDKQNLWKCTKCGQFNQARKGMSVHTAPSVLVIQLKRFNIMHSKYMGAYGSGTKLKKHIKFRQHLRLPLDGQRHANYELNAVLVHAGYSTDCGHYYAFVKGPSGQWYEMNDESVRWVSIDTVLNQTAYMLFYSKIVILKEEPVVTPKIEKVVEKVEKIQEKDTLVSEKKIEKREPTKTDTGMNLKGFLATLKTTIKDDKPINVPQKENNEIQWDIQPAHTTSMSMSLAFGGLLGKLQYATSVQWVSNVPDLVGAVEYKSNQLSIPSTAVSSDMKNSVPFNPQSYKNGSGREIALFGKLVQEWEGGYASPDGSHAETTSESLSSSSLDDIEHDEMPSVITHLKQQQHQILRKLNQEDWKHRKAGRLDAWDESLDAGKLKKVRKHKEFEANEGHKNAFQQTLKRKYNLQKNGEKKFYSMKRKKLSVNRS